MKLHYFRGFNGITNFGDELNLYLWPRFLPSGFDHDDGTQFVGIGTLLNDRLPPAPRTVVFGAGVGYYGPPRRDNSWEIYCVRGPLSARALGLPADAAVTDPAALIRRIEHPRIAGGSRRPHAYMPHWQSEPDEWAAVCAAAGIAFIDPRWPTHQVLDALRTTDVLITEAMHGAIVADALRIPWVPVRTRRQIKSFKWEDWCLSVEIEYRPYELPTIWPEPPTPGALQRARRWAKRVQASRALARIAKRAQPLLSSNAVLDMRLNQLDERLEQFRERELTIFNLQSSICSSASMHR
jgi:succinoglycan biosynthesis protein ExoV